MLPYYTLIFILLSDIALGSCPAYIFGHELPPAFIGSPIDELRLFTMTKNGRFKEIPLQIDDLDANGTLAKREKPVHSISMDNHDRLSANPDHFNKIRSSLYPCQSKKRSEWKTPQGGYAYLASCKSRHARLHEYPVTRHPKLSTVSSQIFSYKHSADHILIFEKIKIQDENKWFSAALSADMWMHLDVKNFFTLNLDHDNMSADLEKVSNGPLGAIHHLAFYIHVLFFKIDLELGTLFSFYEGSAHAPMKFDVPINASERLHDGSGILLHWEKGDSRPLTTHASFNTPIANPTSILKGPKVDASRGLKSCHQDDCTFNSLYQVGTKTFRIQTTIARHYVEKGFYPQFVPEVTQFLKEMDWEDEPEKHMDKRIGIFFHNVGLTKGTHGINHWFSIVDPKYPDEKCPTKVTLTH